jgi:hypothetical protein
MPLEVDPDYIRNRMLPHLIGKNGKYASAIPNELIEDHLADTITEVEQRLSTRFKITTFKGWMGPGPLPDPPAPDPLHPEVEAIEYEGPYLWPSISPGPGYPSFRVNIRPVIELVAAKLILPGANQPGADLNRDWFRVDSMGEMVLMPSYGAGAFMTPQLPFGLFNWYNQRIPEALLFEYRAGMNEYHWRRFPQISHLVGIRTAIQLLPALSQRINPTGLTSESGDGLSISRKSGYVFADLEERMKKEGDETLSQILDKWDGTASLSMM